MLAALNVRITFSCTENIYAEVASIAAWVVFPLGSDKSASKASSA